MVRLVKFRLSFEKGVLCFEWIFFRESADFQRTTLTKWGALVGIMFEWVFIVNNIWLKIIFEV